MPLSRQTQAKQNQWLHMEAPTARSQRQRESRTELFANLFSRMHIYASQPKANMKVALDGNVEGNEARSVVLLGFRIIILEQDAWSGTCALCAGRLTQQW